MNKNNSFRMLLSATVAVLAVISLAGSILLHTTQERRDTGSVLLILSVVSVLLLLLEAFVFRNQIKKYVSRLTTQTVRTQRDSLVHFPAPCVIIDKEKTIVWFNKLFESKVYSEDPYGEKLDLIMNIDLNKAFETDGCQICVNKRYYLAKAVRTDVRNELTMVYFNDITEYTELRYDAYQSHNSVIIIVIDNYDELMSDVRESEKAHAAVEIEKLMESFLEGTNAIAKKVSDDRFYVFMEERYLARKIENRFRILEAARQIRIGGRANVTLSIGVGREGKGLEECEKLAKQALELCQGRGGDQAAYRENGEFRFFGGVSSGSDNNNRVKIRIFAETLLEIIKPGSIESIGNYRADADEAQGFRRVLIMGHRFGDLDSVGSATGLCCALRKIVSECYVVVDKTKNLATSLIDYIEENAVWLGIVGVAVLILMLLFRTRKGKDKTKKKKRKIKTAKDKKH